MYSRIQLLPITSTDAAAVTAAAATEATPLPRMLWPSQQITKDGCLYVDFFGRYTSTGTPGTVIIDLRLAKSGVAFASAVTLCATATLTVGTSKTNQTIHGKFEVEVLSLGAGGAGVGQMRASGIVFNVSTALLDMVPATAPMTAVSVDTTSDQQIMLGITPSVATGSWTIHSLNAEYSGT